MKILIAVFLTISIMQFCYGQDIDSLVQETVRRAENLRKVDKDFNGAIALLQGVLEDYKETEWIDNIVMAPIYHKIGVNHYYFGDMENALKYNSIALKVREKEYGKKHIDVIRGYFNRGSMFRKNQDFESAKSDVKLSITLMEDLMANETSKDTLRLMKMYKEYYRINNWLRDNETALEYWNKVYSYYLKNESKHQYSIAGLLDAKGIILYRKKNYNSAVDYYNKSINCYKKITEVDCSFEISRVYQNLAISEEELGNFKNAKESFMQSIKYYFPKLGLLDLDKQQELGDCYTDLISLSSKTKEWSEGKAFFRKALEYTTQGWGTDHHPRIAEIYRNRTKISLGQNRLEEAVGFNQKALGALLPEFQTDDPLIPVNLQEHSIKNKISFLETMDQRADIFTLLYEQERDNKFLLGAFESYQSLDTVITQILQSYEAQGSQFELIEQSYPIYEKGIGVALKLYELTGEEKFKTTAYHYASKNKALVLLSGMQADKARAASAIPAELKEKEKKLKRDIYQVEAKIYRQAEEGISTNLKDSLFFLRREYQKLIDIFEEEYVDYYNLKYAFDKTMSIAAIQQKLRQGSCLLEYFIGDKNIYTFIVTPNGFDYVKSAKPEKFDETCFGLRKMMEEKKQYSALKDPSYHLYTWILEKPLSIVEEREKIDKLIFIPDGPLMQLSFDVFLKNNTDEYPHYLLYDYSISYAYSNQLLFGKATGRRAKYNFAGFGLQYDDLILSELSGFVNNPLASLQLSRMLGPLPYSDDEVREVAKMLNGKKWLNSEATRDAFMKNAGDYAILHLSMHGVVNEHNPLNSALIFNRPKDGSDYFLRAADLYSMELKADMAVLSACSTGAGNLERGEGVRSLARAFSAAGCPSLVATFWNASDLATKDILVDFYKNLKMGMEKDEAMRQAKLTFMEDLPPAYQSPFYWSHLSVIGESRELEGLNVLPFWKKHWYLIAVGVIVLGGLVFRRQTVAAA